MKDSIDDYFTIAQAAAYLGVSASAIRYYIYHTRRLTPDINLNGRQLLFTRATLDALNATRRTWRKKPLDKS